MTPMPITRFPMISCGKAVRSAGLAASILAVGSAFAESSNEQGTTRKAPEVKSVIGALALYRPEYLGGEDYELTGVPYLDLQYNQYFFNPINGAGIGMRPVEALTIGLGLGYAFGRDEDDADRLDRLEDIEGGARVSFFADYKFKVDNLGPFLNAGYTLGFSVGHQFTGSDTGVSGDIGLNRSDRLAERFLLITGLSVDFGSEEFQDAWFSITEKQSLRSGLPTYDSDNTFHALGTSSRLIYFLTRELNLITAVSFMKLIGDAGDSPVVQREDQLSYQLGFSYAF